ncbi:MAG: ABA4-like family protein [Myxococcota bacterium]
MNADTIFSIANASVMPFWLLLLVAPRWRGTDVLVHGPIAVVLLAPLYAYMLFGYPGPSEPLDFSTLDAVVRGFSVPHNVVGGWIHYLIFDLFIGAWESRDARRHGVPHLFVVPCLILTLMLGPLGLLAYVIVRFATKRKTRFQENAVAA